MTIANRPFVTTPSPKAIALTITPAPNARIRDHDSRFPLSWKLFEGIFTNENLAAIPFQGNGVRYEATLSGQATRQDLSAMQDVIGSLRFPSLPPETEHAEWASVETSIGQGPVSGSRIGIEYVMEGPKGIYALDVTHEICGREGESQNWDAAHAEIVLTCPGGPTLRYDRHGTAAASNPPRWRRPLQVHRVITAWDGTLLEQKTTSPRSLAREDWP